MWQKLQKIYFIFSSYLIQIKHLYSFCQPYESMFYHKIKLETFLFLFLQASGHNFVLINKFTLNLKSKMNILSADEMRKAEVQLLKIVPAQGYSLRTPNEAQAKNISNFNGSLFPAASHSTQKEVEKVLSLSENIRSVKNLNSNSIFQMLAYNMMSILYQDKYRSNDSSEGQNVNYLLQTFKCSLYSSDVDFCIIKNVDFSVDTIQMKALTVRFLHFMEGESLRFNLNRIKWVEWMCQHNPVILRSFVLLFRVILTKLEIQGAQNYKDMGSIEESIINLIEYFDMNYRNFGDLFLFYEDGVFLLFLNKEIVAGDYYENENEKQTQKQQHDIKASVKQNMIESVLMNVQQQKASLIILKKSGIIQSDMQLMNCMLESGEIQDSGLMHIGKTLLHRERQFESQTPTFKENPDQFHFGRKKKESFKDNDIKTQFDKLMDKSQCSEEYVEQEEDDKVSATPFLGNSHNFDLTPKYQANRLPLETIPAVDSPIDELDNIHNFSMDILNRPASSKYQESQQGIKRSPSEYQQVEPESVFTPESRYNDQMAFSLGTENQYYHCEHTENVSPKALDWKQILQCKCRNLKRNRNTMNSKVIMVGHIPEKLRNSTDNTVQFGILSSSYKKRPPINPFATIRSQANPKLGSPKKDLPKQSKHHKPSFLKSLKKSKDDILASIEFGKSTVTEAKCVNQGYQRKNSYNVFSKKSDIMNPLAELHKRFGVYNEQKDDCKSSKSVNIARIDHNRFEPQKDPRGGFGSPRSPQKHWQTSTTIYHNESKEYNTNYAKKGYISTHNAPKENPYKFYAPVQIIAPTVYFGSSGHNSNNFVFKVNEYAQGNRINNPENKGKEVQQQRSMELMKNNPSIHSSSNLHNYKREKQF